MADAETIAQYLRRMADKDAVKGGSGLRDTREVADYFDISVATARRRLWKLVEAGEVEACGMSSTLAWRSSRALETGVAGSEGGGE